MLRVVCGLVCCDDYTKVVGGIPRAGVYSTVLRFASTDGGFGGTAGGLVPVHEVLAGTQLGVESPQILFTLAQILLALLQILLTLAQIIFTGMQSVLTLPQILFAGAQLVLTLAQILFA